MTATAAVALGAPPAMAQGFGIYEHGTCAMARAGTGVAAPCGDGSAAWFNPAGLASLSGWHVAAGATVIAVFGGFTDDFFGEETDLDNDPILVPHAYVSWGVSSDLGVGLGVFAPYGLETHWPTSFDGRFAGYDNKIQTIYIQPTVAYRVSDRLSIGGGVDVVVGKVELNQRLDLAEQSVPTTLGVPAGTTFAQFGIRPGTDFADAHLKADATGWTFHVGGMLKVNDHLSIGARWLHYATMDYEGDASFDSVATGLVVPATIAVGALVIPAGTPVDAVVSSFGVYTNVLKDSTASASITNPEQFVAGLAYKLRDDFTLLVDWQWTRWGRRFRSIQLNFDNPLTPDRRLREDYNDTHGIRVGGEWVKNAKLTLRGGYLYHQGAAPAQTVTPLLPEGARNEFTAGVGYRLAERVHADVAYQYIRQNDRRGRVREAPGGQAPTTALNTGLYTFGAHLFGVTLAFTF